MKSTDPSSIYYQLADSREHPTPLERLQWLLEAGEPLADRRDHGKLPGARISNDNAFALARLIIDFYKEELVKEGRLPEIDDTTLDKDPESH